MNQVSLVQFVAFVCYNCGRTYDDNVMPCQNPRCNNGTAVAPIIFQIDPKKIPNLLGLSGLFSWEGPSDADAFGNSPGQRRYLEITAIEKGNPEAGKNVSCEGRWDWEGKARREGKQSAWEQIFQFTRDNLESETVRALNQQEEDADETPLDVRLVIEQLVEQGLTREDIENEIDNVLDNYGDDPDDLDDDLVDDWREVIV